MTDTAHHQPSPEAYEVQTLFTHGFENCWTDTHGNPVTYATVAEAQAALAEHLSDTDEAVSVGDLVGEYWADDFRIVRVLRVAAI